HLAIVARAADDRYERDGQLGRGSFDGRADIGVHVARRDVADNLVAHRYVTSGGDLFTRGAGLRRQPLLDRFIGVAQVDSEADQARHDVPRARLDVPVAGRQHSWSTDAADK